MPRQSLQPSNLFSSKSWGFSQVVITEPGKTVHISGQVAWDKNGLICSHGFKDQFRQVMQNIFEAIKAAGGTPDDIQMLRLYIPNFKPREDADLIAELLIEAFGTQNPPASSWIGVQALAQPEYLIEIDCVAILPN